MEGTAAAKAAPNFCPLYRSGETAAPPKGKKMFALSLVRKREPNARPLTPCEKLGERSVGPLASSLQVGANDVNQLISR